MRFSLLTATAVALATQTVVANTWFGGQAARTVYNKWHETELERWLSDHNIPYPTPADRKDLESLVKNNWDDYVVKPYSKWDTNQMSNYITSQGKQIKKGTEKNKESLLEQVQSYWHETADQTNDAYHNVQDWIFNSWTDSQLKSFLDHNGVPNPSPRTRDSLLSTARANYQSIANKAGETFQYPGNWLYENWSDSDIKSWLDERGIPAPQPGNRDKLIATMRRNARVAANSAAASASSASASAHSAQQSLSDQLINSWSESELKAWFDKQGIKVPQGSKKNELVALARKHSAQLGGGAPSSASSAYGAATTSAGNFFVQATNDVYNQFRHYYDFAANQFGMASKEAQASLSSASSVASVEASKSSSIASKSASSASKSMSKSGGGVASSASSAAKSASSAASKKKDEL